MKLTLLSDVCEISSGGTPSRSNADYYKGEIPWAKISDIEGAKDGVIFDTEEKISTEGLKSIRNRLFPTGTLLFAMYGSIGKVAITGRELSTNQAILGIRPKSDKQIDLKYLKIWFERNKQKLLNQGRGVALQNLSATIVRNLQVPLPPLDDQIRIATVLTRAEQLIAKRKDSIKALDELLKSTFLEMFGDPVRNEKGWERTPMSKIGIFHSGGTPSKERTDFWEGSFPWVSPKDMKVPYIAKAQDYISDQVFKETALKKIKPRSLLIVVRGMILVHSFPTAINTVSVAINQDMKAIVPNDGVDVEFLKGCVDCMKHQILALITTAGHGTKKFDADAMDKVLVPVPPLPLQNQFAAIVDKIEVLKAKYQQSLAELENLYGSLSQRAFKGELDLSGVRV